MDDKAKAPGGCWQNIDESILLVENECSTSFLEEWACGAAGSALPWHGRGRRFDPDQVHQSSESLSSVENSGALRLCRSLCHKPAILVLRASASIALRLASIRTWLYLSSIRRLTWPAARMGLCLWKSLNNVCEPLWPAVSITCPKSAHFTDVPLYVPVLGNGMEEVVGSIPTKSTKLRLSYESLRRTREDSDKEIRVPRRC
jgi:hypothetical protein